MRGAVRCRNREADADGQAQRGQFGLGRQVALNALTNPFGDARRIVRATSRQDDGEFFPAESRADIKDAHRATQDIGDLADDGVAHKVAVLIVDRLEVVDVDHQQPDRQGVPLRALQLFVEPGVTFGASRSLSGTSIARLEAECPSQAPWQLPCF